MLLERINICIPPSALKICRVFNYPHGGAKTISSAISDSPYCNPHVASCLTVDYFVTDKLLAVKRVRVLPSFRRQKKRQLFSFCGDRRLFSASYNYYIKQMSLRFKEEYGNTSSCYFFVLNLFFNFCLFLK